MLGGLRFGIEVSRFGVRGEGFRGFAVRGCGCRVSWLRVFRASRSGVVEVSRFGISRFLVRVFEVRVSGFRRFGVSRFGL